MTDDEIYTKFTYQRGDAERERVVAFARAIERKTLERAAKVCDEVSVDRWNLYKGREPYTGAEDGRASAHVQGESDGADKCVSAIHALIPGDTQDR